MLVRFKVGFGRLIKQKEKGFLGSRIMILDALLQRETLILEALFVKLQYPLVKNLKGRTLAIIIINFPIFFNRDQ